jgi:glycosyltransferase involved in cell wall biosynthesis
MRFVLAELSPSGGLFQFAFQLGAHLARQGHDVELVTGPDPELSSDDPAFRVLDVLPTWHAGAAVPERTLLRRTRRIWRGVRHVTALGRLLRHLRRTQPDVMVWHTLRFPFDSWAVLFGRRLAPRTRMAIVLHEPRPLAEQTRTGSMYSSKPLRHLSRDVAVRSMDAIFVLGEQARAYVEQQWRPAGAVRVIPHGDEGVFLDGEPTPADETPQRVLFFGNWTRYKGIDVLLEAFAKVRADVPDAELVLAGAVGGDVVLDDIIRMANAVGGVDLRPGYVAMADVPGLLLDARVVAAPYLRASQSGVVHLAQTFARPVVASEVGDVPAAVPHGEAGLLVPPGNAEALAAALSRLLTAPVEAKRMGDAGRRRVSEHSSWDDIATDVAKTLQSLEAR